MLAVSAAQAGDLLTPGVNLELPDILHIVGVGQSLEIVDESHSSKCIQQRKPPVFMHVSVCYSRPQMLISPLQSRWKGADDRANGVLLTPCRVTDSLQRASSRGRQLDKRSDTVRNMIIICRIIVPMQT
jgi:hypothetical protein